MNPESSRPLRILIASLAVAGIITCAVLAIVSLSGRDAEDSGTSIEEIRSAQDAFAAGFAPYVEHATGSQLFAADQPETVMIPADSVNGEDVDPAMSSGQGALVLDPTAVAEQERLHAAFLDSVEGWLSASTTWQLPVERDGSVPSASELSRFNAALIRFREAQGPFLDLLAGCTEREVPSLTACDEEDPAARASWNAALDSLIAAERDLVGRS